MKMLVICISFICIYTAKYCYSCKKNSEKLQNTDNQKVYCKLIQKNVKHCDICSGKKIEKQIGRHWNKTKVARHASSSQSIKKIKLLRF